MHITDNKKKLLFILRSSKTHNRGSQPQFIKITSKEKQTVHSHAEPRAKERKIINYQETQERGQIFPFCPYQLLREYIAVRPKYISREQPFFVFSDGRPVTLHNMRSTLNKILSLCGFHNSSYGSHSFRIERAVDLLKHFCQRGIDQEIWPVEVQQCLFIPKILLTCEQTRKINKKASSIIFYSIPGNVQAFYDAWIIGDAFFREQYSTLQGLKTQALIMKKSLPYVYDYFNLFGFFTSDVQFHRNILSRVQNAILEAFNRRERLPRCIILVLDKDLIAAAINAHFDCGIKKVMIKWTSWITNLVEKLVDIRREQLMDKKAGAVAGSDPKIIWVKMITRPFVNQCDARFPVLSLRNKFNGILEDLAHMKRNVHILEVNALEEERHFSPAGQLNQFGAMQFWKEVDYHIKRFDRREVDLKPIRKGSRHAKGDYARHSDREDDRRN